MISFGEYRRDSPYRVETYCGRGCHKTMAHYLSESHTTVEKDCYACAGCGHLVFVSVPGAPKLKVVLPD